MVDVGSIDRLRDVLPAEPAEIFDAGVQVLKLRKFIECRVLVSIEDLIDGTIHIIDINKVSMFI